MQRPGHRDNFETMEFQDYAATEASSVIGRLLANRSGMCAQQLQALREAVDAAARALEAAPSPEAEIDELVTRLTEAAYAEARRAGDESRRISEEARKAIDEAEASVRGHLEENARLAAQVARADAEAALLKSELQTAQERAEAAERDFLATVDAHGELEAALEAAGVEARRLTEAKAHLEHAIAQLHDELATSRSTLEHAIADANRLRQEVEHQHGQRADHERTLHATNDVVAQRNTLAQELDAAAARERSLQADLTAAIAAVERHDIISTELEMSRARAHTLEAERAEREDQMRQLQLRLDEALQAETRLREQAEAKLREGAARAAESAGDAEQTEALRWELERMVSLFDSSVRAVNEMATARTSSDLLSELVKRLSLQFSRVALFRVKGQSLEGEHQVGFEDTDIAKLVVPTTADSLLTRVINTASAESVTGQDIRARLGVPFGGAPTSAVALPIVLQGNTIAVVYADDADMPDYARGPAVHESSVGFAKLLVGEAAVLLMCHTHELKTLAELRQYATTLLQEAKEMYLADAEAGKPAAQLRARLKDNLECASQLYTYRAAMEGTAAAVLLDEQIAAEMSGPSTFARDLADVVRSMTESELGLTAEAS